MDIDLRFAAADAVMLYFGDEADAATNSRVHAAASAVESALGDHLVDLVPSYASLLVLFDPLRCSHLEIARRLRRALAGLQATANGSGRDICLPVYYAPEAGQDLEALAREAGLAADEVIALHSGRSYRVYAIGFAPGFAYLGEVDERIARPRLATPRSAVPAGAVAIADRQTAVYPAVSPGGWNLIGLCPTPMFDPAAEPPMPVAVGDSVRFRPIDRQEYLSLGGALP